MWISNTIYSYVWICMKMSNYMNSYEWICIKISEKEKKRKLGFQPGTNMACNRRSGTPPTTPPPQSVPILFIYRTIRRPSEKADYTISPVWHSQPLKWLWCGHRNSCSETIFLLQKSRRWAPESGASCPWSYYGGFSSSSTCVSFALLTIKMYGHSVSIFFLLI